MLTAKVVPTTKESSSVVLPTGSPRLHSTADAEAEAAVAVVVAMVAAVVAAAAAKDPRHLLKLRSQKSVLQRRPLK